MSAETQKVDVLSILDSHAKGIELAYKQARGANRKLTAEALCDFKNARSAIAELIEAASNFLVADDIAEGYGSGIGGPDHDRLESALARIGGTV